jgi:hypothetical protein
MFSKEFVVTITPLRTEFPCERYLDNVRCTATAKLLVSMTLPMSASSAELGAFTVGWRYCFTHAVTFVECVPGRWETINDLVGGVAEN